MADIPFSNALAANSAGPRRQMISLVATNASLAVPSWAQGGKGFVIVNGVGPGGSGSIRTTSGQAGAGGGAGGIARDVRILIPNGTTTLNAVIGAAGAGVTGAAATVGANGGDSSLTIGSLTLVLGGGQGGQTDGNGGRGGYVYFGAQNLVAGAFAAGGIGSGVSFDTNAMRRGSIELAGLVQGATGQPGGTTPFGNGALSPFGAPGAGPAVGPTVNTNGANAVGHGAGGSGALWTAGGNVTSGAGAPSIMYIEFVEGL